MRVQRNIDVIERKLEKMQPIAGPCGRTRYFRLMRRRGQLFDELRRVQLHRVEGH